MSFLKEFYYYWIGFSIALFNRVRYYWRYKNPRPVTSEGVQKSIEYATHVVNQFEEYLRKVDPNFQLNSKRVLEIGPGPDLGTGLVFFEKGVSSYTAIDKFTLLVDNSAFYDAMNTTIRKRSGADFFETVNGIKESVTKKDSKEIILSNFAYVNVAAEEMESRIELSSQDLVVSQAVLEHMDNIEKVFSGIYNALADGGMMCHEIDFRTHSRYIGAKDPLNILRFPQWLYKIFRFAGAPNRLRMSDYLDAIKKAGFQKVYVYPLEAMDRVRVQELKIHLSNPFLNYDVEDLRILTAVVVAKK